MYSYQDFSLYQKRIVPESIRLKHGYWFLDTGMGKTVLALALHDQLKKRNIIRQSLVIAKKKVMNNVWRQEAKIWDFAKDFTFSRIHGSEYRGSPEYSRRTAFLDNVDFHLINYEGLQWLAAHVRKMKRFPWQCVFYDESTLMKRSTTKRFKAFKSFMNMFPYRWCLTGTPIPNGLEDIFGQAYCIDQGAALGKYITPFRENYMRALYQVSDRVTVYDERPGARKEVAKKISNRVMRLKKTEHLKLPPLKYHPIYLELPTDQREIYQEFENEFFLSVGGVSIEAMNKVSADMKLRQFLQGRMYTKGKGETLFFHDVKLQALKNLLGEIKGNTLIGYNFHFERDDIWTATGSNLPYLDGRTSDSDEEKFIIGWNNYEYPIFLVNPASAAHGLNLQAGGNNIIWYSLTWDAEHFSQCIDRLWRQGQRAEAVNVYLIIFKDTIDEKIAMALQRKDGNQKRLMEDIVRYKNARS